ncbi:mRNA surveillance protein pelota [Candidatus Woesearchaeota archaeon]|nr:mRNA surveillance protein pelota [Candidatus Woesearchaeota archaeon]
MKQIHINLKKGEAKLKIENMDDLWCLSHIIEPDDLVRGKTIRKIKIGESDQRKVNIVKKTVFIEIRVENTEFHEYSSVLRVSGTITQGPEDIQKGSYHTFNLEPGSIITIIKKQWLSFQVEKIKQASVETKKILICILDRDEACFGLLKKQGFSLLSEIKGDVEKKADLKAKTGNFYGEVVNKLYDYVGRYKIESIILASPAFWKEDLMKNIKNDEIKKKITLATCSCSGKEAINEVLKRPEVKNVLSQQRVAKELEFVESLLEEISKNNLAVYGLKETEKAVNAGAVEKLLVTDRLIQKTRAEKKFEKIDQLMKNTESMKGSVTIIGSDHDGGKKLDGLGGIAAILRYKLNY